MPKRAMGFVLLAALWPASAAARGTGTDDDLSGAHVSLTRVRGTDRDAEVGAFGFWESRLGYGYEKGVSLRVLNAGSLAAGAKGLQGGVHSAVAGGYRFDLGRHHGPVLRGGFDLNLYGNKFLWDSAVELPQGHAGWQWMRGASVIDVAFKGGYVLFGRHNTGHTGVRELDGVPEIGGIASVRLPFVDLRASYTYLFPRREGDGIQWLEASACGIAGRLMVCSTHRYEVGEVWVRGMLRDSETGQVGITVGLLPK